MLHVDFDDYTWVIPRCCGNCRYYDGECCRHESNDGDVFVNEEDEDCLYFQWEE